MFQVPKTVKILSFIATVAVLSMSLNYFVFAWTEPSNDPPTSGSSVSVPINISTNTQVKNGRLDVNELRDANNDAYYINPSHTVSAKLAGNVGIGLVGLEESDVPSTRLDIVNSDNGLGNILKVSSLDGSQGVALGLNYIREIGSNANNTMYIDARGTGDLLLQTVGTGNVGIGVVPLSKLDVNGGAVIGATYAGANAAQPNGLLVEGNVGIGRTSTTEKLEVTGNQVVSGDITAAAFYYSSDERLKENIKRLDNSLEKIMKLNGISYTWKENGGKSIGVTAQNVETVFPDLVKENKTSGMKTVEYGNLVAPMIEAIKQQQKMIEDLQKEVETLKSEAKK